MHRISSRTPRMAAREVRGWSTARTIALLALAVVLAVPTPALGQGGKEALEAGITAYQAGQYTTAITRLQEATQRPDELSSGELALAFMYLGGIYTLRRITAEATPSLEACVRADPGFVPDEEIFNPDQVSAWRAVRDRLVGQAEIHSTPAGADISVDGRAVGTTPFTGWLLAGERRIRIESPGYRAAFLTLTVQPGEVARLLPTPTLVATRATLYVEADPPHALISINDGWPERGPIKGEVPAGSYVIRGELEGYVSDTQSIDLEDRGSREILLRLTETPEHARAREDMELREEAGRIHSRRASGRKLRTILYLTGTAAGVASGVVLNVQANDKLDVYYSSVEQAEMDRHYSDYESRRVLSQISYGVAGGMLALGVLQILRSVPSVEEILQDLRRDKGLSVHAGAGRDGELRVGLAFDPHALGGGR